ncbi:MAG TPA: protease modulator HflC [Rhodospirillaceae bacterium]|nr:HflC protein [Alphaproteobacteria bacterium]OUT41791.1 MAG: HflC protein [Micavibrio sp. TMED2]HCI47470.1 protease modulator HflC [Rhodospirillaceae bacterium]MAS46624.1 HflC protein [Alphaproteobacteria bacterium]MAX94718.1 HflC protein [Alphaproteobacteria bacterium]|tara:strand:- start:8232 stop:9128 length:897 start_codon:yes stop_codon:yes gene_type:complete
MNSKLAGGFGVLLIILAAVGYLSAFTVSEREQALVLQFGEFKRQVKDPGLHFKIPFVQNVVYYEDRILDLDPPVEPVLLADQKRLLIDTFARYRIEDPLTFFQAVTFETQAQQRLNNFVNAALRSTLGNTTLVDLLSDKRVDLMQTIRSKVQEEATDLGIQIIDVRIRRADLPDETSDSIYQRMQSEREREAAEFRAQGDEQAQQIRSRADREVTVIAAEAQRDAEIIRGEGDQTAIKIYADAFNQDADFYAFYRSLEAYRRALADDNTTLLLSPDSDFFKFFGSIDGGLPGLPKADQ